MIEIKETLIQGMFQWKFYMINYILNADMTLKEVCLRRYTPGESVCTVIHLVSLSLLLMSFLNFFTETSAPECQQC